MQQFSKKKEEIRLHFFQGNNVKFFQGKKKVKIKEIQKVVIAKKVNVSKNIVNVMAKDLNVEDFVNVKIVAIKNEIKFI